MMMMAHSSPSNERLPMNVLGGEDRIKPVRNGSLRKMRDRPQRQRQNSRKATSCLFLQLDDEQDSKFNEDPHAQDSVYPSKSLTEEEDKSILPAQSLRKAYSQPAVKQLQAQLRHIVERALKDPSNDAAKTELEQKHEEMEALVHRQQAVDDVQVHYGRPLINRPDRNRRARTEGSIPWGKSL